MMKAISAFAILSLVGTALAATYPLSDNIVGDDFYDEFEFQAIDDPTHGRVNYVDEDTARLENLTYASDDTFVLRTDFTTTLDPWGPGRNSVRIRTRKTYTTHVSVFDVRHMPQGCGTWPAIWEVIEPQWPNGGETDILEGVNDQGPNAATLHTGPGCAMPAVREHTGTPTQRDCDANINGNTGCGVRMNSPVSYGPEFNRAGGGWYAMERTPTFVKVWFWSRHDGSVPREVRKGAAQGTPSAFFPNDSCDFDRHFREHNIIINLTLCGDWAGSVYPVDCPSNCVDHVNSNPGAFSEAYFDLGSVRVYA